MGDEKNPYRIIAALNTVLFRELGFQGNRSEYYDPRNSFLNDVIIRKKGIYQVMTNFLQSKVEPANVTCPRFKRVSRSLAEQRDVSVDLVRSLLKVTAQQFTTYSTICDLTNGVVYVHHRGDFDRTLKIDLKAELAKGERVVKIESLFKN